MKPITPAGHDDDQAQLEQLGYKQELHRGLGGFSNFAISLSIICILAGGITSFHVGLCSVGGAAIGLGWPLCCLFSLAVALTMGQVASAFPTAGGLYHWASILGGRGWGWATAWFNLAGLLTVLAAINVGLYRFLVSSLGPHLGYDPSRFSEAGQVLAQTAFVLALTATQAGFNHFGIRLTTRLTDFSGYWILLTASALTLFLLLSLESFEFARLFTFTNLSGLPEKDPIWPSSSNLTWLFLLGLMLPAYTLTGFDASAHVSEETIQAVVEVPRGMIRSVLVSGVFGWVMLCSIVLAAPSLEEAARQGDGALCWIVDARLPGWRSLLLYAGIGIAQYLCGLATITSASRMAFAFARDGGLPFSAWLRWVSPIYRTPIWSIWTVAGLSIAFTVYARLYEIISATAAIFLYLSYVLPTALGFWAYRRSWVRMGPWDLGPWYRPLALVSVLGTGLLFAIGIQPPYEKVLPTTVGTALVLLVVWMVWERKRFPGPPRLDAGRPAGEREEKPGAQTRSSEEKPRTVDGVALTD